MYIRISRATFEPANAEVVSRLLLESEDTLGPALKKLPGFQSYRTGIDLTRTSMIAVSTWDNLEQGAAVGQLPEMIALREPFQAAGVIFEPISTYYVDWEV